MYSYSWTLIRRSRRGCTVLIDTVWLPFAKEFVDNLEREINLDSLDLIVQNHAEIDHSGALPELLRRRPDLPIYCTANAVKSIKGHFHQDWDFHVVKTGDSIDLGNGKSVVFVEAPMLHWPDSMFTYLSGEALLFSNDAFGQPYATESLFNDLVDKNDVVTEVFRSKGILLGSPTVNKGILNAVAGIIEEIRGLRFKGKKAASFGCYGWSGEGPKVLNELLKASGFEVLDDGFKALWEPDSSVLAAAFEYGKAFAEKV